MELKEKGIKIEFSESNCKLYYDGDFIFQSNNVDEVLEVAKKYNNTNKNENENFMIW